MKAKKAAYWPTSGLGITETPLPKSKNLEFQAEVQSQQTFSTTQVAAATIAGQKQHPRDDTGPTILTLGNRGAIPRYNFGAGISRFLAIFDAQARSDEYA
ncbi:hypothetical protein TWF696_001735 [Orbilia brochopaga]|uniref:Uncharacterized protein n=1 Tax=Orbilia brochopaga TaxID=3140254 RepID=A0AAV9U5M2_9PEZI